MQTYVGDIISNVRADTRNADVPSSTQEVGIATNDILRYLNYGQERLQARVARKYPWVFLTTQILPLVASQSDYIVNDNLYLGTRIIKVEFSASGDERDYYRLPPTSNRYRTVYPNIGAGRPYQYERRNNAVILQPLPQISQGNIKVWYERTLDRLDTRRGTIVTATSSPTQLTALTLDTTTDDEEKLPLAKYLCINDQYGNVKMYNIPITSYDTVTGVVTLSPFTFQSGESASAGDYVTIGLYTTTHSKLEDEVERYLTEYANWKMFRRDSSEDAVETDRELKEIEEEIVDSYKLPDKDIKHIGIYEYDFMLDDMYRGDY